jgi:hypothetical protein
LVITEFGCRTYQGAPAAGGMGWAVIDHAANPKALNGAYVRDDSVQVAYFTDPQYALPRHAVGAQEGLRRHRGLVRCAGGRSGWWRPREYLG